MLQPMQPPAWYVQEARHQLDDDASWEDIAELAWKLKDEDERLEDERLEESEGPLELRS